MLRRRPPRLLPCGNEHLPLLIRLLITLTVASILGSNITAADGDASSTPVGRPPAKCSLADLMLRYEDRPIDLKPPYRPHIFQYTATMDYSMDVYLVNARPDTGCVVDGVPTRPTSVDVGGNSTLTLYARSAETQQTQAYVVTVRRLLGSETDLDLLRVEGSTMSPVFDPMVRDYEVNLNLAFDEIRITYRLLDNEQRIRGTTQKEVPTEGVTTTAAPEGHTSAGNASNSTANSNTSNASHNGGRRLQDFEEIAIPPRRLQQVPGEIQHAEEMVSFMLDVGFTRKITLTVQCADAAQANIGAYRLKVKRPSCSQQKPYFEPQKQTCVNFCPSGFYKHVVMGRCAKCNTNCMECKDLETCMMCKADTPDYEYLVQPDGSCRAYTNHIFKKYQWWCAGLAVCLFFLVLVGCAGLCQVCCTSSENTYKTFRTYSDSDEETQAYAYGQAPQQRRAVGGLGKY